MHDNLTFTDDWSATELEDLMQACARQMSLEALADLLLRFEADVRGKAEELGLGLRLS